jgi:DNA invertase Pin-like site-specific DNA recombinase
MRGNSRCQCGSAKDPRAQRCAKCARAGYSKGQKGKFVRAETEQVLALVSEADSYADLARRCKVSRQTVTRIIEEAKIDISHFTRTKNQRVSDPKKMAR